MGVICGTVMLKNILTLLAPSISAASYKSAGTFFSAASKQTMGDERHRLNALLTALAYTQLELYRCGLLPKDADMATEMRIVLKGHSEIKGMVNRDESGHSIDNYLKQWK